MKVRMRSSVHPVNDTRMVEKQASGLSASGDHAMARRIFAKRRRGEILSQRANA
jgi:hypothetical protein